MKHIGIAGLLLILIAACQSDRLGPASPDAALGGRPVNSLGAAGVAGSATGSAHITYFPPPVPPGLGLRTFGFSAVKQADGSVSGQWQIVVGATILHGPIDCLTIETDGHSARISGLVSEVKPAGSSFMENTAFAMELFDNGPGASADPDVSTQLLAFRNADPQVGRDFCEQGTIPSGADLQPLPLDHGNFTVRVGS